MKILVCGVPHDLTAVGADGIEWTQDLLGNYGDLHCNDDGHYFMSMDAFCFWDRIVDKLNLIYRIEPDLDETGRELYDSEPWPSDIEDEVYAKLDWLDRYFDNEGD